MSYAGFFSDRGARYFAPTYFARRGLVFILAWVIGLTAACSQSESPGLIAPPGARNAGPLDAEAMSAAVDEMLRMTDTLDRNRRAIELIDSLTEENLPGAIEAYEKDLPRVDPHESRLFANAWAKIDPEAAVSRMLEWRYPKITFQSIEEAVYVWASSDDAASARAYVDPTFDSASIKGRTPTKFMVMAVVKALAASAKFEELTGLLESLDNDVDRELFITEVMIEMNRAHGLETVKKWVEYMPWESKNDLKVSALKRGLDWVSRMSGPGAAYWYEEVESHPRAIEALSAAASHWGVRAPQDSIPWLSKRPQSEARDALMRQTAIGWLARAPEEAEAWLLASLEDDLMRDLMLGPLANARTAQRRYPEALEIIEQIPSGTTKDYAMAVVLSEWTYLDKEAVDAYITTAEVPESVLTQMKKRLDTPVKKKRRVVNAAGASGQDGDEG